MGRNMPYEKTMTTDMGSANYVFKSMNSDFSGQISDKSKPETSNLSY